MCGFLGQFGGDLSADQQIELDRLLQLSRSRGPDETRSFTNAKDLWLGFNRLSILDLTAAGSQPMRSSTGRYTIVFNGEIYNHLDLRAQLHFAKWRGHSDTETILGCFEEWGFERTLTRLDGMFAFAVYDELDRQVMCARDFAGIKPLFFGWDGIRFVFASQYDQIAQHSAFRNSPIDKQVFRLYLEQHFMPAPFGLLRQTGQLEPGQWLKVSRSGLRTGYYWRFPEYTDPSVRDENEAYEIIEAELDASVSGELISDVPLGAFLSGGIDSPLVCHYAARHMEERLKTFTIGSDSQVHDETELAQGYADLIGTDHRLEKVSASSAIDRFDEATGCVREPMADFSVLPTYFVSCLARRHVKVALSGDGGDELFFGYERFWSIAKNIKYQTLPWVVKAALYKADKILTKNANLNSAVLASRQDTAHRNLHSRFPKDWIERIFPDLSGVSAPEGYGVYTFRNSHQTNELIQAMRKAEFYGMMQKTLRKVDLASMGASLEVRVPFLKKSFLEAVLKIDPMLSYGPNKKKLLLKGLLKKLYPPAPIDNVKRGFSVPLGRWFAEKQFRAIVLDKLLKRSFLEAFGGEANGIRALLASHGRGRDLKWPLFTLLALQRQTVTADINTIQTNAFVNTAR